MSSSRPDIPSGFLGAQPKFSEIQLQTDSHRDAEFRIIADNNVKIKIRTEIPVKVVTKLTQCSHDKELPDHVFVQRKNKEALFFYLSFPENGWYKFMIFALPESDPNESLPNMFNYLINIDRSYKPGEPFLKAYTKFFKDCCFLEEPFHLSSRSSCLDKTRFQLTVPGANKVAVHCGEEWFHLNKKSDKWEGIADLFKYKGRNTKVTVNGSYEKDGSSYSVLLEGTI